MAEVLFYALSALAILFALGVVLARSPMLSVISLLGTFFCLSVVYLLAGFQFLAAAQVLVYAGAILVLFLFTVMLLNAAREDGAEWDRTHPYYRQGPTRIGGVLAVVLLVQLVWAFSRLGTMSDGVGDAQPARRVAP